MKIISKKIVYFILTGITKITGISINIVKIIMFFLTAFFCLLSIVNFLIDGKWITNLLQAGVCFLIALFIEIALPIVKEKIEKILAAKIIGVKK
ncbi:hypothetical protein ACFGZK_11045 [Pasteurella multocida]